MNKEILGIEDFQEAMRVSALGDWHETDSGTMIAPPPSLADTVDTDDYDADDDAEAEESSTGSACSDVDSLDPMAVEDNHNTTPFSPIACFFLLEAEMHSIQKDIEGLHESLDTLIQGGVIGGKPAECKASCIEYFLNGSRSLNWPQFAPFIDDVVSDLMQLREINKRTNDVIRRIRTISKIDDGLLNIWATSKPPEDKIQAVILEEEELDEFFVDDFVQVILQDEIEQGPETGDS